MPWRAIRTIVTIGEHGRPPSSAQTPAWEPIVDIQETTGAYVLVAEIPGVAPDDVTVSATVTTLTLSGARRSAQPTGTDSFLQMERGSGLFSRTFTFPEPIDVEGVAANVRRGLLMVRIPKAGPPSRRIDVD